MICSDLNNCILSKKSSVMICIVTFEKKLKLSCSHFRGTALSPETEFHDPRDRDMRSEFSSDSIEHSDLPLSPERQFDRQQLQWLEDLKNRRAKIVQVVYPRTANNEKELTVIRGEILEVLLFLKIILIYKFVRYREF